MDEIRFYRYRYLVESVFMPAVGQHFFKLRAVPCENVFQRLTEHRLTMLPADCHWNSARDGLGNAVQYGQCMTPHAEWRLMSEGVVESRCYCIEEAAPDALYLYSTSLTQWDANLKHWAEWNVSRSGQSPARDLMHAVHRYMRYRRFRTDNRTTALEVFWTREGVCQDYAHLMVAACRSIGLYARYVNGLVLGEGATHAWVEVYEEGRWLGFDPTQNREIDWGYLKIAHGRDVNDCPSNRGQFYGCTSEQQRISVIVQEVTL